MIDLSDTPAGAIARLDDSLARRGVTCTLRRYVTAGGTRTKTDTSVMAHVRGVKAEEMVQGIQSDWSKVVLSPTGISSFIPLVKGDKLVIYGKEREIQIAKPIYMQDALVRYDLMVAG